jgi:hypothetical protein
MRPSTFWVPKKTNDSWIPKGFVFVTGPDNELYIVPEFMVPALDQEYNAKQKKLELRASSAPGSVSHFLIHNSTPVLWSCVPDWHNRKPASGSTGILFKFFYAYYNFGRFLTTLLKILITSEREL